MSDTLAWTVSAESIADSNVYLSPIPYKQCDRGEEQHWNQAGSVGRPHVSNVKLQGSYSAWRD